MISRKLPRLSLSDDVFRRDHGYSPYLNLHYSAAKKGKSRPFFAPGLLFASNSSGVHSMISLHNFMRVIRTHICISATGYMHHRACPKHCILQAFAAQLLVPTYLSAIIGGPPACSIPSFLSVSPDCTRDLDLKLANKSY